MRLDRSEHDVLRRVEARECLVFTPDDRKQRAVAEALVSRGLLTALVRLKGACCAVVLSDDGRAALRAEAGEATFKRRSV
jgi:hypothetical protein